MIGRNSIMMGKKPNTSTWNILSESRYFNILLAVKSEPLNNYQISNEINLDHSQTRKPVKELLEIGALIPKKERTKQYNLNKKWIAEETIDYYIQKNAKLNPDKVYTNKNVSKEFQNFLKLKESKLTLALIEMYLTKKNVPTQENLNSFFENFANFVKTTIDMYGIQHIDIDLLNKLLFYNETKKWELPQIRILLKHKIHFKKDKLNQDYFNELVDIEK
jgi:predicted transcriptional regulator